MRRFTPRVASAAIDNCWIKTGERPANSRENPGGNGPYPARDDLRSPVTAFSAARLISEA
jgi:hypothetical protein